MPTHIFFSWQTETPNAIGRNFLRQVLDEVCEELATEGDLEEAVRDPKIDSDTQGVAGQPPIAETIFKKIDNSAVVIADMTLTGKRRDGRPSPNPNVLLEYGWALKSLGHSRVISVMNTTFGEPSSENLPFDLAHLRWPMQYKLPEGAAADIKKAERKKLKLSLREAIQASLATVPPLTVETQRAFPGAPAKNGQARFRGPDEALGYDEDLLSGANHEVFLADGAAMWIRLMPATVPTKQWKVNELKAASSSTSNLTPLVMPAGGYSYVRASDGYGMYRVSHRADGQRERQTNSIAFAFRTSEVWSVDTMLLAYDDRLPYSAIEAALVEALDKYNRFQLALGALGPFRWKAGLVGIKGRYLVYPLAPGFRPFYERGHICVADEIECEGVLGPDMSALQALLPFSERIFEECGLERPDYLPKS